MGVVNVTPDSFSDGGRYDDTGRAIAHGLSLLADGADLLDVGGESTRPGATRPLLADELGRVVPVIEALAARGATVSVDTMRATVAARAVEAGATIINDVSGGLADPEILDVAAQTGATYVAMHWRAHSATMQDFTDYGPEGVVAAVRAELAERVSAIRAAGVADERIVLDPGLGFAKLAEHNWELVRRLDVLAELGFPLLVGASRKTFLGRLLADEHGEPRAVGEREAAGIALSALLGAGMGGAPVWCLRVHDVRAHRDGLAVAAQWTGHTVDRATGAAEEQA
ncbi:dihydropteroate synthase [Nocardioides sp. Root190]|uniref:dihydropteroate synthase n=1 Tax=Nocardioides sp. Root190 TaxID=1736488 RepID=UPI0009EB25AC|nr:dihydropteroate synthase [Nocardioides sp. Root190]